jgi:arginyl-tRNA synthetase
MKFDDFFFESVVGEYGVKIVREFLAKGVFEESQGAVIFPGKKHGLHDRVFINSLGLPTYETKELGLAPEKYRRFAYDFSIIITGNEIDEYFKVLLKALTLTNPDLAAKTTHLSHGMVRLPEGKMSSRTGKILTGEWLLNQAHAEAWKKIDEVADNRLVDNRLVDNPQVDNRQEESARNEQPSYDPEDVAEKVGLGAVKYAFLKSTIGRDIAFSFEDSLSFQGNSGPYLQYTFVRCQSVLNKALELPTQKLKKHTIAKYIDILINNKVYFEHQPEPIEFALLRNIYTYYETLELATREIAPHHVAGYLYQLAQSFNAFYGECVIINKDQATDGEVDSVTSFRLLLTATVSRILAHGMQLLGIPTVERM